MKNEKLYRKRENGTTDMPNTQGFEPRLIAQMLDVNRDICQCHILPSGDFKR